MFKKFLILMKLEVKTEVVGKKLAIASGLYLPLCKQDRQFILKRMLPASVESVLEDLVGLEHVVNGGHGVVGLDYVDVEDVDVLKSEFEFYCLTVE